MVFDPDTWTHSTEADWFLLAVLVNENPGPPPAGVNVKVRSNFVGTRTSLVPTTCAGEKTAWPLGLFIVPCPMPLAALWTSVSGTPLQVAVRKKALGALVGAATAGTAITADAAAATTSPMPARVSRCIASSLFLPRRAAATPTQAVARIIRSSRSAQS